MSGDIHETLTHLAGNNPRLFCFLHGLPTPGVRIIGESLTIAISGFVLCDLLNYSGILKAYDVGKDTFTYV